jgi:hypothetical protein
VTKKDDAIKPRQTVKRLPNGKRPQPKGGSRLGKPNKTTHDIKSMILAALNKAGGEKYLYEQAIMNPVAFLSLLSKIMPRDVNLGIDANMRITNVTHTIIDSVIDATCTQDTENL